MKAIQTLVLTLTVIALLQLPAPAAPARSLSNIIQGAQTAPKRQWFIDWFDDRIYVCTERQFYDNAAGQPASSYPWGGAASTAAVRGVVASYTTNSGTGAITAFTVAARITNDLYQYGSTLTGTTAANDHGQTAVDIPSLASEGMQKVYLAASFAKDDSSGSLPTSAPFGAEPSIHATGFNAWAWYCYNNGSEPPTWSNLNGYWVPAWCFTSYPATDTELNTIDVIEPGNTHEMTLSFTCDPVLEAGSQLYNTIVQSKNSSRDIFISRSTSLKISTFPSQPEFDTSTAFPADPSYGANVAVFYNPNETDMGVLWFRDTVLSDHTYWPSSAYSYDTVYQTTISTDSIEAVTWNSLTLQASGTIDDSADITSVGIWLDTDADGAIDSGDTRIGSGVFPEDNGTVTITLSSPQIIPANSTINVLISYSLNTATIWPGSTYELTVTNATGIGSTTHQAALIYGLPTVGATTTLQPSIGQSVTLQESVNIGNHIWWQTKTDPNDEMLGIKALTAGSENIVLDRLMVKALGTGNDSVDITSVDVWLDKIPLGSVGAEDTRLATGTYFTDNGTLALTLSSSAVIPARNTANLLFSYHMNPLAGMIGQTYQLELACIVGHQQVSGSTAVISGTPKDSAVLTRVDNPVSIYQAKHLPVGSSVVLVDAAVTADFRFPYSTANLIYIEEENRTAGIGIDVAEITDIINIGSRACVYGKTRLLDNSELIVDPEIISFTQGNAISPLGVMGNSLGGSAMGFQPGLIDQAWAAPAPIESTGLNTVGMYIIAWGKVTGSGNTSKGTVFWIDDGSGLRDGFTNYNGEHASGLAVLVPITYPVVPSGYVSVKGILRAISNPAGVPVRLLVPYDSSDIISF